MSFRVSITQLKHPLLARVASFSKSTYKEQLEKISAIHQASCVDRNIRLEQVRRGKPHHGYGFGRWTKTPLLEYQTSKQVAVLTRVITKLIFKRKNKLVVSCTNKVSTTSAIIEEPT